MTNFQIKSLFLLFAISYLLLAASSVSAVLLPNPLGPGSNIFTFIDRFLDLLFTFGLPLAVIMILWSALQFLTSGGNPQKIQSAKNTLLYTMVGFGILLLSKGIIKFICNFFGASCP